MAVITEAEDSALVENVEARKFGMIGRSSSDCIGAAARRPETSLRSKQRLSAFRPQNQMPS